MLTSLISALKATEKVLTDKNTLDKIKDFIAYLEICKTNFAEKVTAAYGGKVNKTKILTEEYQNKAKDLIFSLTQSKEVTIDTFNFTIIQDFIVTLPKVQSSIESLSLEDKVIETYGNGKGNWGDLGIFEGGYINFGYWDGINTKKGKLIHAQRVQSSANLYLYTLNLINPSATDTIVELGCGRGAGMINFFSCKNSNSLIGVDITDAQIDKAKAALTSDTNCMKFIRHPIDSLPMDNNTVDKIYSVEVLQHVVNFPTLAAEIKRVLKVGGQFAFVADFATSEESHTKLGEKNLLISPIEILEPIQNVNEAFKDKGFDIKCESIGKSVFEGYRIWVTQKYEERVITDEVFEATNKIFQAYDNNYIDYYACTCTLLASNPVPSDEL
jgi:cyclopropane fatty-acyl-phospholipid synthase-like methyltransferase